MTRPKPSDALFRLPSDVVVRHTAGEAVMLKLNEETVFALNSTAALVVRYIGERRSVPDIIDLLASDFGQSHRAIGEQVGELLETLRARGLVEQVESNDA